MPSKKPIIAVYTEKNTIEKMKILCKLENRSISQQTEYLIKRYINEYEEKHGKIKIETV